MRSDITTLVRGQRARPARCKWLTASSHTSPERPRLGESIQESVLANLEWPSFTSADPVRPEEQVADRHPCPLNR